MFGRGERSVVLLCAALAPSFCQVYLENLPNDHPAIQYPQGPFNDPVAKLQRHIDAGAATLDYRSDGLGYLPALLERLGVAIDSQALVFSKTSFQAAAISPRNPRAIYFSDDVAVGWVRGGAGIEIAALDPVKGVVFYTLGARNGHPAFERRNECLQCHQGPSTQGVPGFFIGSVYPNAAGSPSRSGAIITDHRTAFEDRWGGWYVNAKRGEQRDRANSIAPNPAEPETLANAGRQNLVALPREVNLSGYLSRVSDIVALMTFEHQTQMINFITRVGWEARLSAPVESDVDALVKYMLFADEAPLKEPMEGFSTFTSTFPKQGPRDRKGRSLRDFDLQTRLFRYPLSYMIYSAAFDALPDPIRDRDIQEDLRRAYFSPAREGGVELTDRLQPRPPYGPRSPRDCGYSRRYKARTAGVLALKLRMLRMPIRRHLIRVRQRQHLGLTVDLSGKGETGRPAIGVNSISNDYGRMAGEIGQSGVQADEAVGPPATAGCDRSEVDIDIRHRLRHRFHEQRAHARRLNVFHCRDESIGAVEVRV